MLRQQHNLWGVRLKRIYRLLSAEPFVPLWRPMRSGRAVILMWHRFTQERASSEAYPVGVLDSHLAFLRRSRMDVVSLTELFRRLAERDDRLERTVALTVDDGYADFAELAAPVFEAYDCPVTVFVTTGFLDGSSWMWWDQVDWMLRRASMTDLTMRVGTRAMSISWNGPEEFRQARNELWTALKQVPDAVRLEVLEQLAVRTCRTPPTKAPGEYEAMTWAQVRALSGRQVHFGAHTVTHPVLSRCDDEKSRFEIEESWRRLRQELPRAVPIFAYPNGLETDFSEREWEFLRSVGVTDAVSTLQRYADAGAPRMAVPRLAASSQEHEYRNVASGLRRVAMALLDG